jgi:methyl-accepting chemotaxis protein
MFRNVRIRTRLIAGFAMVMLLLVLLSTISIIRVEGVNDQLTTINSVNSVKQRYAINFRGSVHDRAIALRDVVLLASPAERSAPLGEIEELTDKYAKSAAPLDRMLAPEANPSPQELSILSGIKDVETRTLPVIQEVIARKNRGDDAGAQQLLMGTARPLFVEWLARINQFIDLQEASNKAIAADVQDTTASFLVMTITLCLAALAAAGTIAWWSVRALAPLNGLADVMKRLAGGDTDVAIDCASREDEVGRMGQAVAVFRDAAVERTRLEREKERTNKESREVVATISRNLDLLADGDLTASIDEEFSADYQVLKTNFNRSMARLRELIGSVVTGTEQIRTGSSEIAQAAEDLARRTEGTAASLEQTSAAVTQMDGRLKATAGAASETVQRADQTIATVAGGRSVAEDAVQAMSRVSDSAKGIDSVIEGLDKIAFQTRVLAMNAAVEAGRAGEAGRGFAVVADLVSALAMRAEEEAKRARDQLTVTQTDIVTAVDAVRKVDGALQNISTDVGEVHQLLATIAGDNQAQAHAIEEINLAIGSMDQTTQQNAAMVEETSAAARNLFDEVSVLNEQAARFKAGSGTPASATTSSPLLARAMPKLISAETAPRKLPREAVHALKRHDDDWREF